MTASQAGQYRIAYKVTDEAKHEIEGGYVFSVMGEGNDHKNYRFNAIELVTDKREYLAAARAVGAAFREIIGAYNAAMTAVEVRALMEDRAKVEIEATAIIPD